MSTFTYLYTRRTLKIALALVLAAVPLSAQLGLGLSPMRLELHFPANASQAGAKSGTLTLTNGSSSKARVRAEILDFFMDSQETPQFARGYAQESKFSCRNWISVNPMETEVEAGSTAQIRYTVHVPEGISERGYHCAAGFTTLPAGDQISGTGLKTAVRVVAAFYVTVGDPAVTGGLKNVTLERATDKDGATIWRAIVLMGNPGQIHYRPTGQLEIIDQNGKLLETHNMSAIPVLPGRDQRFVIPIDAPMTGGGYYTLRARVDIGTHEIQEASVKVTPISVPAPNRIAGDGGNPTASPAPVSAPVGGSGPVAPKQ